ncbi:hypothetical protein POVWA2_082700 [Plasmodium ovale wallikeri]|uniref:CTLH domain-containing protein n=2 Tax=Plasmodium ovale TaxID=36330 RepID=A0A1A9APH1_PLAOA|nr:hypothetical protein POVWA1_043210 [Plasmodium ovale wallikeri]SBT57995.1 hypothetical protein POVWA2_082700 [Plasmodium ovale wallikeri]SBT78123.1 conserved Plasmodium protein, unknown function [Plasmodium ovale]
MDDQESPPNEDKGEKGEADEQRKQRVYCEECEGEGNVTLFETKDEKELETKAELGQGGYDPTSASNVKEEKEGISKSEHSSKVNTNRSSDSNDTFYVIEKKIDEQMAIVESSTKAILTLGNKTNMVLNSEREISQDHPSGNVTLGINTTEDTLKHPGNNDIVRTTPSEEALQREGQNGQGERAKEEEEESAQRAPVGENHCGEGDIVDTWTPLSYLSIDDACAYGEWSNVSTTTMGEKQQGKTGQPLSKQPPDVPPNGAPNGTQNGTQNLPSSEQAAGQLRLNAIDKSFVQIPLKCILNTFRNIQKELEKNFTIITLFIEKKLRNLSDDEYLLKLNTIIEKLEALKNKVNESKKSLDDYINRLMYRLRYIYFERDIQLENLKHDFRFESYENRINWLIDGYLARYGFFTSVNIFCKRYKLEYYSDADVYKEYIEIINELKKHNIKPALDWCQKYKSQLKKINSKIESELHLQLVINLIFENKFFNAIEYIKKTVTQSSGNGHISPDVKFVITYIGLNRTSTSLLKTFSEKRWKKIIRLFKKVYSDISGVLNRPLLELLLKAGISVIKADQCGKRKSTKCPTCIDELRNTLSCIPTIQKTKSFLVCPYMNEVMDENNPPFTTPAGHVFSEKAIPLFLKSEDIFQCPFTEEKYRMDEFSRLFI